MDVVPVLVDIVAQHLLALLVDGVHVVDDNHLLVARRMCGPRLAKRLHFIAEITDTLLLLQIVDKEDVVLAESLRLAKAVVLADEGVQKGGLAGGHVAHEQHIQGIAVEQLLHHTVLVRGQEKVIQVIGLVFLNKRRKMHMANYRGNVYTF